MSSTAATRPTSDAARRRWRLEAGRTVARWELRQAGGAEPAGSTGRPVMTLRGRLQPADVAALRLPLRLVHDEGDVTALVCDVTGLVRADLGTVDALARLQVLARRLDYRLVLRGASDGLRELIDLLGLAERLPCVDGHPAT